MRKFLKKPIFWIVNFVLFTVAGCWGLRLHHINKIEENFHSIQLILAETDIVMSYKKITFNGFFWHLEGKIDGIEFHMGDMTIGAKFDINKIDIDSKIKSPITFFTTLTIPNEIDCTTNFSDAITSEFNIKNKYNLKITTIGDTKLEIFNQDENIQINTFLEDLLVKISEEKEFTTIFDTNNVDIKLNYDSGENKKYKIKINDANLYLVGELKKIAIEKNIKHPIKNLNVALNFNESTVWKKDGTRDDQLKLLLMSSNNEGGIDIDSNYTYITKFKKNEESQHNKKMVINFKIKNLDAIMDYGNIYALFIKEDDVISIDPKIITTTMQNVEKIINDNAEHLDNNTVIFDVKDTDKGLMFANKPFMEVFAPIIDTMRENYKK